ncbi:tetratricopeptide repeat protein [Aquimarina sp. W85]|uniref:tetratricopeptide repeat-containing sensor histidine kinase n=1 Tax=Aquimarina rhodophyticola TaxID=3342246 RepID=UPI00366CDCC4
MILKLQRIVIAIILVTACSCTKDQNDQDNLNDVSKSEVMLTKYLNSANNRKLTAEERLSNANSASYWNSKLQDDSEKRRNYTRIGLIYYYLGKYDEFKSENFKGLKLSKKLMDSVGIAKSYVNIGSFYNYRDQLDSSFYYFYNAVKIYNSLEEPNRVNYGTTLFNLAIVQKNFKDYVGAEASIIRAIDHFKSADNPLYLYSCYNNLGIISKELGRYEDAIQNYQNALNYARRMENGKFREIQALNNIGVVFKSQKLYDKAIDYYMQASAFDEILEEKPKTKALLMDNIAYAKFLAGTNEGVLSSFLKSKKIRDSINDKPGLITNNLHLAEYFSSLDQDSTSVEYALVAKKIAKDIGYNKELLNSLKLLSDIAETSDALYYAHEYIKLNDSLQNQERISSDKFARVKFETDEIVEKNEKISKENEILIITVVSLAALFVLVYIIFRQRQSNNELLFSQKQQESNQEIYRLLLNQQVKLEEGRQMEQQRMSEELHDGVLGRLFGVRLSLDGINQRVNDGFTEYRTKYIDELKSIEREIRLISHDLGTETFSPDVAYVDVIESLISDQCAIHEVDFTLSNDENIDWEDIDDFKKVNIYRIIQESLQNIFKHANAEKIEVSFKNLENSIKLVVLDNGVGFKYAKVKKGIGLRNINSRVKQMDGEVKFVSTKESGTKIIVNIPVSKFKKKSYLS